jgi:HTH-type transcriptional regulator/antitoxin HigA
METMSTATARVEYASLLRRTAPAVIHSERENERCISMLEALDGKLDRKGAKLTAAERRLAELLTVLIEDFEEKAYALKPARPIEVLRELMQANDLKQKDLLEVFGTPSIVSEVLREKRALTVEHIRKLSRRFHVSPEVFF